MDATIDSAVSSALSMQGAAVHQQKQMMLLKQALEIESTTVTEIMQTAPQLAQEGSLGRSVNTYA